MSDELTGAEADGRRTAVSIELRRAAAARNVRDLLTIRGKQFILKRSAKYLSPAEIETHCAVRRQVASLTGLTSSDADNFDCRNPFHEDGRAYEAWKFIDGRPPARASSDDLLRVMPAIASLHAALRGVQVRPVVGAEPKGPVGKGLLQLRLLHRDGLADSRLIEDARNVFLSALCNLARYDGVPVQLLHGDLCVENMVLSSQSVVSFIDFDDVWTGPVCADIAWFFVHCSVIRDDDEICSDWQTGSLRSLLDGYLATADATEPMWVGALEEWLRISVVSGVLGVLFDEGPPAESGLANGMLTAAVSLARSVPVF